MRATPHGDAPPEDADGLRVRLQGVLGDRYQLRALAGTGSSAVVFRATDVKYGRDVAIKVLRLDVARSVGQARFLREIDVAARLTHPHILAVFDSGAAGDLLYYVMPHVEGETLRNRLARESQLPLDDALRVTRDVVSALEYAHQHGVMHRDVKPENILLAGNAAVLGDFGLAGLHSERGSERITASGLAVGTAAYMSPEQGAGDAVDGRTDVYSLACVLFEMLAGVPPFVGPNAAVVIARHRSEPPPSVRHIRPLVPEGIDQVITSALAKLPADRPQGAAEFGRALEGAMTAETRAAVLKSRDSLPAVVRPRVTRVAAGALVLAGLALTGYFAWRSTLGGMDRNRVAVAPFDILATADSVWGYGLASMLSRGLDGAGPLQTVPASVVFRAWRGTADRFAARDLGRQTRAGLVVFGEFVRSGADSVRVRADVLDVDRNRTVAPIEVVEALARLDRLPDSLSVRILRALAAVRTIAAVPQVSLGSRSMPALKAFLQGEQLHRLNDFHGARVHYEAAVAFDSTWALPHRRLRSVQSAIGSEFDAGSVVHALAAGRLGAGLTPKDSLLIVADSLAAANVGAAFVYTTEQQVRLRRRIAALREAGRRFPSDPEVWNELGEALYHVGDRVGEPAVSGLAAFEQAIAQDSGFTPAYLHAVELNLAEGERTRARVLVRTYRRFAPADQRFALIDGLLSERQSDQVRAWQRVDTMDYSTAIGVVSYLRGCCDSVSLAEDIAARLRQRAQRGIPTDTATARAWLALLQLHRGKLAGGARLFDPAMYGASPIDLIVLASRGAVDSTLADSVFTSWAASDDPRLLYAVLALPALGVRGDFPRLERRLRETPGPGASVASQWDWRAFLGRALAAHRATAAGDASTALSALLAMPDSLCGWACWPTRHGVTMLLERGGRYREAARLLDRHPPSSTTLTAVSVLWLADRLAIARLEGDTSTVRRLDSRRRFLLAGADAEVRLRAEGLTASRN